MKSDSSICNYFINECLLVLIISEFMKDIFIVLIIYTSVYNVFIISVTLNNYLRIYSSWVFSFVGKLNDALFLRFQYFTNRYHAYSFTFLKCMPTGISHNCMKPSTVSPLLNGQRVLFMYEHHTNTTLYMYDIYPIKKGLSLIDSCNESFSFECFHIC